MEVHMRHGEHSASTVRLVEELASQQVSVASQASLTSSDGVVATLSGPDNPSGPTWSLVVIGDDDPRSRTVHLEAGAADCVSWPAVSALEIAYRLRAIALRHQERTSSLQRSK